MTIHKEEKDMVIDGWNDGIADSPHLGTANLRSVNITTVPGDVAVNFKTAAMTLPPTVSLLAFTADAATDTLTFASTAGLYENMAITLNTVVTATGITAARVYWIRNVTATTFQLTVSPTAAGVVDITLSGSGTWSSYTMTAPLDSVNVNDNGTIIGYVFFLDDSGRVWWVQNNSTLTSNLVYIGNSTLTSPSLGRGICVYKQYIIVFRSGTTDALALGFLTSGADLTSSWTYGFASVSSLSINNRRAVLVGEDDKIYYNNSQRVGSISENTGSTFDPTSSGTYTKNIAALDLPRGEEAISLGELGQNLLIGSVTNKIFPWDRISVSFDIPIELPESYVSRIASVNATAYIFAGFRGRIYQTTGSVADLWKKIPDHLSGEYEPYYTWQDADITRGQVFFTFTASKNDGTVITSMGGLWAIDLTTKALRQTNQLSFGNGGTASIVQKTVLTNTPAGMGVYVGWTNAAGSAFGVDTGSSNPYIAGEAIIETEIIPVGTYTFKETPTQIEFKLSRPLVSGETIELFQRPSLADSYVSIGSSSTVGAISDAYPTNFENVEWMQLKAVLTSSNTTPSFVPLHQLRIRP